MAQEEQVDQIPSEENEPSEQPLVVSDEDQEAHAENVEQEVPAEEVEPDPVEDLTVQQAVLEAEDAIAAGEEVDGPVPGKE